MGKRIGIDKKDGINVIGIRKGTQGHQDQYSWPAGIWEADLEKNVDELLLTQSLNEELRQNQNEPEDDLSLTKSLGDLWTKKPGSGE